jgi:hypothetical protein
MQRVHAGHALPQSLFNFVKSGFDAEHRIKPSADIALDLGFPAEVASSLGASHGDVPFDTASSVSVHRIHEPVTKAAGDLTTDFASELLKRARKLVRFKHRKLSLI